MKNNQWRKDKIYVQIQSGVIVLMMATLLGVIGWLLGGSRLALIAVSAIIFLYFLNPVISPALVLGPFGARRLHPREAPQLYTMVAKLAARAGLPAPPSLHLHAGNPMNAFTVGDARHAAIAVSGNLIQSLNPRELAAVLAHEVSHIRNNDTRLMGFAALVGRLTGMLSMFGQILLFLNLPLLLLGEHTISWIFILMLIFAPTVSMLMQLTLSRTREYQADLGAAELTGDPRALASALAKIDRAQKGFFRQNFWPLKPWQSQSELWRTHPPTSKRIRRLLDLQGNPRSWDSHRYPERFSGYPAARPMNF
jgi:heat shock protein HtpX